MTTVAIMQPYFLPYIGYFQLIHAVDVFVVYDNIKYTKKGWINRNRILKNGADSVFTLPLQHDSDALDVRDRAISAEFNRTKLLNQFRESYRRAPQFESVWPMLERIVMEPTTGLFDYIFQSIVHVCEYLGITSRMVVSSNIAIDPGLKGQDKVIGLCRALSAKTYLNAIGGRALYSDEAFLERGIDLRFLQSDSIEYPQFAHPFVPSLSIVDVLMFNRPETIRGMLGRWTAVRAVPAA
ncbi:WbqC family protein [Cupriavidus cauae]|uniref:WbqC family protein n=1 Tax=Cupriavidus cauae TaxID=2608999 RepID=UPI0022446530|nr:WbqC family protein [Cupriavidus cauae]UZN52101.1 WbqC family protein [Cupriavidus cauae]